MIRNYFTIAWRSLLKRKRYAFINVVGLTSSLVFVLVIAAYVWQTYQVNSDLRNKDQQYVLQSEYKKSGIGLDLTTIGALPKALKEEYPHLVANYYRFDGLTCVISKGDKIYEESVSLGDPTLLDMFGFELFEGDSKTALASPYSVVITESAALKYFGKKEVLGKTLNIQNFSGEKRDFTVTGVLKPTPQNSVMELNPDLKSSIFLSITGEKYFGREIDTWDNLWIAAFVELQENVHPKDLEVPIETLLKKHADKEIADNLVAQFKPAATYYLDDNKGAIRKLSNVLMWTAGFLLLMAVINFINFTVSQSFTRLKEIGLRKIMGSSKTQLIVQLAIEYMMLVGMAGIMALLLYPLLVPLFDSMIMTDLPRLLELPANFFAYFILLVLFIGLLSGIYPAVKLSQNKVLESLKSQLSGAGKKQLVRHTLLFTQFTVTIIVIIASVVISRQIHIFLKSDLGYDKDRLVTVQVPRDWSEAGWHKMETKREELRRLPYVDQISLSYGVPGSFAENLQKVRRFGNEEETEALMIISDQYFSEVYQIPLLAGDFFNPKGDQNIPEDKIVINKKAALALGYRNTEDAVGKQVSLFNNEFTATISGVTDNFYDKSLHNATQSIMWFPMSSAYQYRYFSIRLKPGSTSEQLTALEAKWKNLFPDAPFEYRFTDDTVKNMYRVELQLQRASQAAAVISIIIIALGFLGLISLAINLRLKEIGVRRVLGASFGQIIGLFSKEFYITFFLSVIIGCPLVYILMKGWIENYSIQAKMNFEVFVLPLMALSLFLLVIIGLVTLQTVRANPVEALRDE